MLRIIIPIYNSHNTLPNTLNSLVAQTQKKFLVTIIDDGSDKDYDDILSNYKEKLHISYYRIEKNAGAAGARQLGLDKENLCDYIMFLDSDDMLMPNAIEIINRETSKNLPDILASDFIHQEKYGVDTVIKADNVTWLHGKAYRRKFLEDNHIRFYKDLKYNEDCAFNTLALGYVDDDKILRLPITTHLWVDNKGSITRSDENFLINCIPDFIYGQARSLIELHNNKKFIKNMKFFASNIGSIYGYLQLLRYFNKDIGVREKCTIKSLFECDEVNNYLLHSKDFNEEIRKKMILDRHLYYESQTFLDFCKEFGVKKEK